jgi:hypothetical protein
VSVSHRDAQPGFLEEPGTFARSGAALSHFMIVTNARAFTKLFARTNLPSRVTEVLRTILPPPELANSGISPSSDQSARSCSASHSDADEKGENDRSLILSDIKPDRSTRHQLSDRVPANTPNLVQRPFIYASF